MRGPAITVVVCTRDRPRELGRALRSVARQTFTDFEVVLIDDGSSPAASPTWAGKQPIRILRLEGQGPGAARAAGLDAAAGTFVAYCDDDDEWLPEHLAALSAYLEQHPGVALVYGDAAWDDGAGTEVVPYSVDHDATVLRDDNVIFPTDVLHRADPARTAGGYDPTLSAYEDWDLWLRMSRSSLLRHLPQVLARRYDGPGAILHKGRWQERQRVYDAHHAWLCGSGVTADHDLLIDAAGRREFDPGTWRPPRRELIWHSILNPHQSFGSVARRLLPALEQQGVDVFVAPSRIQPARRLERFHRPLDHWGRFAFYYDYRQHPGVLPSPRVINYAMWESAGVPEDVVAEINASVELQYVPSHRVRDSFVAAGVRVPIRILHHGVDADAFPPIERRERDVFAFGTLGELSRRKGADVLLRAFEEEFEQDEPVQLILHSSRPVSGLRSDDPRVMIRVGFVEQDELAGVLAEFDAFVLPSRGEPFGLLGLEAMATGLPVIATDWDGPAEYLDPSDSLPLAHRLVDAEGAYANGTVYHGQWAEPDLRHLRSLMRRLFENPDEARAMGARAADRVRRHWTWDRPARQVRDDLDELA